MNNPPPLPQTNTRWGLFCGWSILAAFAGVLCIVLPPHLIQGAIKHHVYGWPLIPWFATATANLCFVPSMVSMFLLGLALGVAQPRSWLLLGWMTVTLVFILTAINIIHDWTIDDTSHNLWPFEFVLLAFFALPALVGSFLGSRIKRNRK